MADPLSKENFEKTRTYLNKKIGLDSLISAISREEECGILQNLETNCRLHQMPGSSNSGFGPGMNQGMFTNDASERVRCQRYDYICDRVEEELSEKQLKYLESISLIKYLQMTDVTHPLGLANYQKGFNERMFPK